MNEHQHTKSLYLAEIHRFRTDAEPRQLGRQLKHANLKTRNSKLNLGFQNPTPLKLKTQKPKLKTQNSKLKTQNSKLETQTRKLNSYTYPPIPSTSTFCIPIAAYPYPEIHISSISLATIPIHTPPYPYQPYISISYIQLSSIRMLYILISSVHILRLNTLFFHILRLDIYSD